jgi:hypothetical protein
VDSFKCLEKIKIQSGNKNIVLRLMVLCESNDKKREKGEVFSE